MKKTNLITSLELCKQLKEAGFLQDTHFKWNVWDKNDELYIGEVDASWTQEEWENYTEDYNPPKSEFFAAPTTDELLNELPHEVYCVKDYTTVTTDPDSPQVFYYRVNYGLGKKPVYFESRWLPNALAKMWLYLKKEGLI